MGYEKKNEGQGNNAVEVIKTELGRIAGEVKSAIESQNEHIAKHGQGSEKLGSQIEALGTKYEAVEAELKSIKGAVDGIEAKSNRLPAGAEARKSLGAQFIDSAEFKNASEAGGLLRVRHEVKQTTAPTGGPVVTSGNIGAGIISADRLDYIANPREAHVRDLFSQGTTSSNMVEFPQIQARNMRAGVVADDGVMQKPESDLNLELVQFPVRTIAHTLRIHKSTLADIPALRSIIDTEMVEGLKDAEDIELIKGDGTGNHLRGVLANARTFNRGVAGDTKLDTLRRSLTDLRLSNYRADGFLLNPLDWEDIELLKGTDSRYVFSVVTDNAGVTRVWRTRVVDSIAIDEGQFVSGAFKRGGFVFDREQVSVDLFEQDRDNVVLNLLTLRVEERLTLVIRDQNAFVKGTFA